MLDPRPWQFVTGAIGDAVGTIFRLPAEVACKRLQTGSGSSSGGILSTLAAVPGQSWLVAWSAILLRDVPLGGLQVACYQECHQWSHDMVATLSSTPEMLSDVLAGVLAGAVAAALTTPLDVIVTQTSTRTASDGPAPSALQVRRRKGT
jgi:solute carrier family 25 (mitochondrial S-adenosylmethionine transporter), member 26